MELTNQQKKCIKKCTVPTQGDNEVWNLMVGRGRVLLEVFLAGTGLMAWVSAFFFSPINEVKSDIAIIKNQIVTIQSNHEAHMQTALEKIAALEEEEKEDRKKLETQNEAIIRLLTMHNIK